MKRGSVAFFVPHAGCPHRCSFCDQRAITGAQAVTPGQVTHTLTQARDTLGERAKDHDIAFFGGSFTALPQDSYEPLLRAAFPFVCGDGFRGIRLSTRPDAVDAHTLDVLRRYRVSTIELGAQSMDDAVLARNGRGHSAADVERAAARIKTVGFALGLQMMTGLPGDSDDGARRTARRFIELGADCVRIYPALTLRGSEMERWYRAGEYSPPALEQAVDLVAELLLMFHEAGIPVIRVGLHDSESLRESVVAGPYHPAFKALCDSRIYERRVCDALCEYPAGAYTVFVGRRFVSAAVGNRRGNLEKWRRLGYDIMIRECGDLGLYEIAIGQSAEADLVPRFCVV